MTFPIYKDDNKAEVALTPVQRQALKNLKNRISSGDFKLVRNNCLCGNRDQRVDTIIAEKDRYGIRLKSVLCGKCGLIRSEEIFDGDSIIKFYSDIYRDIYTTKDDAGSPAKFFDDQKKRGTYLFDTFSKVTDNISNLVIFEIGCGAGGILYSFQERNNRCSGADYDNDYLEYGKKMGLNLIYGDYNNLIADQSIDVVILSHVLEHFVDPIREIQKIVKKIRPGGYLIIEVPGIFKIDRSYYDPILYFQNAHVYSFYRDYLKVFFESLGLAVIYGDEMCIFILQKPMNWIQQNVGRVYDESLSLYPNKIKKYIWRTYLAHRFKVNPFMLRSAIVKSLQKFISM